MGAGRAALGAAMLVGTLWVTPTAAHAEAPVFTWSGAAEAASGDARTSTAANWAGGVAPAPGQRVALVFPPLACVAASRCDLVDNDVEGLVATSVGVTQASTYPGPNAVQGGYEFRGAELRLDGPLDVADQPLAGQSTRNIIWRVPLTIARTGSTWHVSTGILLRNRVTGGPLHVVGDGLFPERRIEVERLTWRGLDPDLVASSVYATAINAAGGGPVRLRHMDMELAGVSTGPLSVRDVRLEIGDVRPLYRGPLATTVAGDLRLDSDSQLVLSGFRAKHPRLDATGTVRLNGARLETYVDCRASYPDPPVIRGAALTYVKGAEVRGRFTDRHGDEIADGAVVRPDDISGDCDVRFRIDYEPDAVRLTALPAR